MTAVSLLATKNQSEEKKKMSIQESKKEKKRKRKEGEELEDFITIASNKDVGVDVGVDVSDHDETVTDMEASEKKTKRKKEKKEKKEKARKNNDDDNNDDDTDKKDKKEERAAKRAKKEALLEQVPKTDKDGIAYTKFQIRRMMKRVKCGLAPVATEHEENQRRHEQAVERKEEEQHLAGITVQSKFAKNSDNDDNDDNDEKGSDDDNDNGDNDGNNDETEKGIEVPPPPVNTTKKAKRNKTVPDDYVCQACPKNKPSTLARHWIYDCPYKQTIKGTNKVAKKLRGLHNPDSRKVFVSGLPFDIKAKDIDGYFESTCGKESIAHCKLMTFPDTGRCKGQAIVVFETDDQAKKALKLSGTVIENNNKERESKQKKKGGKDAENKRPELKLKVTKLLNRFQTGKNKSK